MHEFYHRIFYDRTPIKNNKMNASIFLWLANSMKKYEWSLKRLNFALSLIAGKWHSLSEITNITKISKNTFNDLKKRETGVTKQRTSHSKKLTEADKYQIVLHIQWDSKTCQLSLHQLIKDFQLNASKK